MKFVLPQKTIILWQIRIVALFAILCAAVSFFINKNIYLWVVLAVIFLLCALITLIFLPLYFKSYKIKLSADYISITRGFLIKRTVIMPFPRLVIAQGVVTPLSGMMGLKCVALRTARQSIFLPELQKEDADMLLFCLRGEKYG